MKRIFFYIISCICFYTHAQNEATNWYFGHRAGLNFNLNNNSVSPLTDGALSTIEGCATISDDLGKLLFYTDGITVWNKNHSIMPNGRGLLGDPSSTQSAIIVPKPNDSNIYYIFTVDNYGPDQTDFGLNYSTVDLTLNDGLGDISNKNENLLRQCAEKITAVLKDCITDAIWVLAFASENGDGDTYNTFHAFEVNDSGVSKTSMKSTFPISILDKRGYLKLSPDGNKMACANVTDGLFIYDFDAESGIVSNQIKLNIAGPNGKPYGIEFSPNNKLLYVTSSNDFFDGENFFNNEIESNHRSLLTQFNLSAPDIKNSGITIDDRQLYRGALQLGPDGKIYRALSATYNKGISVLAYINRPNNIGSGCNYQHNGINLSPSRSSQGLPPFIASFFSKKIDIIKNGKNSSNLVLCEGDSYNLIADKISGATYSWTRDNVLLPNSGNTLEIFDSGYYELSINPNNGDCTIDGEAFVSFNLNPLANNSSISQCDEDGINDGLTIFNLNEATPLLTDDPTNASFKFYLDIKREHEINGNSYPNISNPQIVYVEITNDNTGCTSYCELTLSAGITDSNDTELIVCDDDGTEDGLYLFDLNKSSNSIINGLPEGLIISYFETYEDALLEQNKLKDAYTNIIPYNQTIFARVENDNNCYGINTIKLTVNQLPQFELEETVYYCINRYPETISLKVKLPDQSVNSYAFSWSTGENSPHIQINKSGVYKVTATNKLGCEKTKTITVENSNIATIESINVKDATDNNIVTVLTSGEGLYQYQLSDDKNIITRPFQDENTFSNVFPGIYTISIKDDKSNCGIITDTISVIGFPKFFTPNNDGVHDTWQIYGVSKMFQPNSKILIFNRHGKLLKELIPLGEGWNGRLNGVELPADDYWFSVKLQDGRVYKNHFALIN